MENDTCFNKGKDLPLARLLGEAIETFRQKNLRLFVSQTVSAPH